MTAWIGKGLIGAAGLGAVAAGASAVESVVNDGDMTGNKVGATVGLGALAAGLLTRQKLPIVAGAAIGAASLLGLAAPQNSDATHGVAELHKR